MILLLALACGVFGGDDTASARHPHGRDDSGSIDDSGAGDDSGDTKDFCARPLSTAAPTDECVTAALACDGSVEATLEGGLSEWVASDYTAAFCFTNFEENDYGGPERIYALDLPADTYATVTLETPCADLDLAAVRWERDTCPDDSDPLSDCEGSDDDGNDSVSFSWDDESHWLLVVDAKTAADAGANFRLSVSCE